MTVFEKIEAQQKSLTAGSAPWVVGEQLKEICRDKTCAEIVSADLDNIEMGLVQCEKKIKAYADKNKTGNFAYVSPQKADEIIRKFYGLPEQNAKTAAVIDLEDFL